MISIPLTNGLVAVIDDEDSRLAALRWCGLVSRHTVYARHGAKYLHREVTGATQGMEVEIIDGDGLNCRRSNLRVAVRGSVSTKHGAHATPAYRSWHAMWSRCLYPKSPNYYLYGGRGITVCERWRDFRNFLVDMGERPPGTSIDRCDGSKGYEPGNCRWATPAEQNANRHNTVLLTVGSETLSVVEWGARSGLGSNMIKCRLRRGWTPELAVSTPSKTRWGRRPT